MRHVTPGSCASGIIEVSAPAAVAGFRTGCTADFIFCVETKVESLSLTVADLRAEFVRAAIGGAITGITRAVSRRFGL